MLVKMEYQSFNNRNCTESTYWSKESEWFFMDHNIPHTIGDYTYPNGVVERLITWSDEIVVEIPDISLQMMEIYCNVYNMIFTIYGDVIFVKFKRT